MRIALVSPLYESVPPPRYGGTERVIAALADELVANGHDVTLFASGGSVTSGRLVPVVAAPLRTAMSRAELAEIAPHLHLKMLADVYHTADDYDIVHAHTDVWTLPFVGGTDVATVVTLHGRLDLDSVTRILPMYPDVPVVSVSDAQRTPLDRFPVRWAGTVHNGLPLDRYFAFPRPAPTASGGDYLAFVGRLSPEKGPDRAVEIADRAGLPLRVAAKLDPMDQDYWDEVLRPLFRRRHVDFVGELDEESKPAFLAGARATLLPIDRPEPFGLVMIESLAAGTPVVAMRRGSVPEILEHGVSGWVCDDVAGMVAGVESIDLLSPQASRQRARRFSARRMAEGYQQVYEQLLTTRGSAGGSGRLDHSATVPVIGSVAMLDAR
jgi:glycosyltransferase involved in cell wall biosynthesis